MIMFPSNDTFPDFGTPGVAMFFMSCEFHQTCFFCRAVTDEAFLTPRYRLPVDLHARRKYLQVRVAFVPACRRLVTDFAVAWTQGWKWFHDDRGRPILPHSGQHHHRDCRRRQGATLELVSLAQTGSLTGVTLALISSARSDHPDRHGQLRILSHLDGNRLYAPRTVQARSSDRLLPPVSRPQSISASCRESPSDALRTLHRHRRHILVGCIGGVGVFLIETGFVLLSSLLREYLS